MSENCWKKIVVMYDTRRQNVFFLLSECTTQTHDLLWKVHGFKLLPFHTQHSGLKKKKFHRIWKKKCLYFSFPKKSQFLKYFSNVTIWYFVMWFDLISAHCVTVYNWFLTFTPTTTSKCVEWYHKGSHPQLC